MLIRLLVLVLAAPASQPRVQQLVPASTALTPIAPVEADAGTSPSPVSSKPTPTATLDCLLKHRYTPLLCDPQASYGKIRAPTQTDATGGCPASGPCPRGGAQVAKPIALIV